VRLEELDEELAVVVGGPAHRHDGRILTWGYAMGVRLAGVVCSTVQVLGLKVSLWQALC
jgi:hypothetical protein